jgi:hypothetical protein
VDDEVSVAEILVREGWGEPEAKKNGRMRALAVMLAVVVGCGLAALLVHFGSQSPHGDSTAIAFPHPPPGGLAGGGVPSERATTEVTTTGTTVVVTEQPSTGATIGGGIPWHTKTRESSSVTTTGTTGPADGGNRADPLPTNSSTPGGTSKSDTTTTTPKPHLPCVLGFLCL